MSTLRVGRPVNVAGFLTEIRGLVADEVEVAAGEVYRVAVDTVIRHDRVDTGNLLSDIQLPQRADEGEAVIGYDVVSAAAYSLIVELGRRPGGKRPPVDVIEAWVQRRLGLQGKDAERAAWAISTHIKQKGTTGIHFMRSGAEAVPPEQLARDITAALRRHYK